MKTIICQRCRDSGKELLFNWWTPCRDCCTEGTKIGIQAVIEICTLADLKMGDQFSFLEKQFWQQYIIGPETILEYIADSWLGDTYTFKAKGLTAPITIPVAKNPLTKVKKIT